MRTGKWAPRWSAFPVFGTFCMGLQGFSNIPPPRPEWLRPLPLHVYSQEVAPEFKQARLLDLALPVPNTWTLTQADGDDEFVGNNEGVRARVLSLNAHSPGSALLAAAEHAARTLGAPVVLRRIKSVSLPAGAALLAKFRIGVAHLPGSDLDGTTDCLACLLLHADRVALVLFWEPHGTAHEQRWPAMLQGLRWR